MSLQAGMPHPDYFAGDADLQGEQARERAAEEVAVLLAQSRAASIASAKQAHRWALSRTMRASGRGLPRQVSGAHCRTFGVARLPLAEPVLADRAVPPPVGRCGRRWLWQRGRWLASGRIVRRPDALGRRGAVCRWPRPTSGGPGHCTGPPRLDVGTRSLAADRPAGLKELTLQPGALRHEGATMEEPRLTPRQLDTLRLLAQGLEYKDIAATLILAEPTVNSYAVGIRQRLGAKNGPHCVLLAIQHGLLSPTTGWLSTGGVGA